MQTYIGLIKTPGDATLVFEACRQGILPRIQRRLSDRERNAIRSGSVFVWDEREAGMRRWTDGKSWSASRVAGSFLTYREMEGKRTGANADTASKEGLPQGEDSDDMQDGLESYKYKADGLVKQSFSITTSEDQKLHLISYYGRSHPHNSSLRTPSTDPALSKIQIPRGLYPESSSHDLPDSRSELRQISMHGSNGGHQRYPGSNGTPLLAIHPQTHPHSHHQSHQQHHQHHHSQHQHSTGHHSPYSHGFPPPQPSMHHPQHQQPPPGPQSYHSSSSYQHEWEMRNREHRPFEPPRPMLSSIGPPPPTPPSLFASNTSSASSHLQHSSRGNFSPSFHPYAHASEKEHAGSYRAPYTPQSSQHNLGHTLNGSDPRRRSLNHERDNIIPAIKSDSPLDFARRPPTLPFSGAKSPPEPIGQNISLPSLNMPPGGDVPNRPSAHDIPSDKLGRWQEETRALDKLRTTMRL